MQMTRCRLSAKINKTWSQQLFYRWIPYHIDRPSVRLRMKLCFYLFQDFSKISQLAHFLMPDVYDVLTSIEDIDFLIGLHDSSKRNCR